MPFEEQPEQIQMADNAQYISSTDNVQSELTLEWKKTEVWRQFLSQPYLSAPSENLQKIGTAYRSFYTEKPF